MSDPLSALTAIPIPSSAPPASEFMEHDENPDQKSDIPYPTLLKLARKERELTEEEKPMAEKIVFYCRDCKAIREVKKKEGKGHKLRFQCGECEGGQIYFGSELGIRNFFRLTK